MIHTPTTRQVFTVSELTFRIKASLEKQFAFIWITGEVTNFRRPVSGHYYFSLKDDLAQISAVMFRGQNQNLKFDLENGMAVTGLGRISVYEPRGAYQIILEYLEPHGIGALQVAFEQLKQRLDQEGYFKDADKKELPFLPNKISLITSPTGAVVHDMQQTINRRFPNMPIQIFPVKVQGNKAIQEIVSALQTANARQDSDVIILARGGGSLEDLQAFNSEQVAKAIYSSEIPIISAVGHETDFTIADFVADVRAATPSVAAELATPVKADLIRRCEALRRALSNRLANHLQRLSADLRDTTQRLIDPRHNIADMRIRIDELTERLLKNMAALLQVKRDHWAWKSETLYLNAPLNRINVLKSNIYIISTNLKNLLYKYYDKRRVTIDGLHARLQDLNPQAILARGYSITRLASGRIVRSADDVTIGQPLEVMLFNGHLGVTVDTKYSDTPDE